MPTVHILQARVEDYERMLRRAARGSGALSRWTVPKGAKPGDVVAYYLSAPVSAFIALGRVNSPTWLEPNIRPPWLGRYNASINRLKALPSDVQLQAVRRRLPGWAYLRSAQGTITVPERYSRRFLTFLQSPHLPRGRSRIGYTEDSDIEGLATEVTALRRSRSGRLRQLALDRSRGKCEACGRDYSRVLQGRGIRVLQVHHRRQLSLRDRPQRTTLKDLAVLCANCHLLVHSEARRPLLVEVLRRLLRSRRRTRA